MVRDRGEFLTYMELLYYTSKFMSPHQDSCRTGGLNIELEDVQVIFCYFCISSAASAHVNKMKQRSPQWAIQNSNAQLCGPVTQPVSSSSLHFWVLPGLNPLSPSPLNSCSKIWVRTLSSSVRTGAKNVFTNKKSHQCFSLFSSAVNLFSSSNSHLLPVLLRLGLFQDGSGRSSLLPGFVST